MLALSARNISADIHIVPEECNLQSKWFVYITMLLCLILTNVREIVVKLVLEWKVFTYMLSLFTMMLLYLVARMEWWFLKITSNVIFQYEPIYAGIFLLVIWHCKFFPFLFIQTSHRRLCCYLLGKMTYCANHGSLFKL